MEIDEQEHSTGRRRIVNRTDAASHRRQQAVIAQLEAAIQEVKQRLERLKSLASEEEERAPVRDPNHVAFPTFAKAIVNRHDELRSALASLTRQLARARRK